MTKFGDDLIAALGQALTHARGDNSGVGVLHEIDVARETVDVKAVRQRVGLKQAEMARIMDMSLSGYRKWEQNARSVSGPARTMLVLMEREPEAVLRALGPDILSLADRSSGDKTADAKPPRRKSRSKTGKTRQGKQAA